MNEINYDKVVAMLKSKGRISASLIQRGLGVGYDTSQKLLEEIIVKEHLVQGITNLTWGYVKGRLHNI